MSEGRVSGQGGSTCKGPEVGKSMFTDVSRSVRTCRAHPSRCSGLVRQGQTRHCEAVALGSPCFSLVSSRAGTGLDCEEGGSVLTLEGLCVSSALRTEFHGLCQCQTCEIQFFSWDTSVIVHSRVTGVSSTKVG